MKIFDQLNCKRSSLIYLLQCRFRQLQYVDKSETSFYIRLNNHRKDRKNKNAILACKYFQNSNHNFQRDGEIYPNWKNYENLYNYGAVTATSTETEKLLDSKTENTVSR